MPTTSPSDYDDSGPAPFKPGAMPAKIFTQISEFIYNQVGIQIAPIKKTMLEARLQKRLRVLKLKDYKAYCDFLFSAQGMAREIPELIDAVTTNTTDFFREPKHFEFLYNTYLPAWFERFGASSILRLWSAGCSTGMEPYTLAMVLSQFQENTPHFKFSIMATDISNKVLQEALHGVYDTDRVAPVPQAMKRKYLLRSKDPSTRKVRIVPELRRQITFQRLNFMEHFEMPDPLDIVFCRNVIIYFDRKTQETLLGKFCTQLKPGGYLFVGHSESLAGMPLPLQQVVPTVYKRT